MLSGTAVGGNKKGDPHGSPLLLITVPEGTTSSSSGAAWPPPAGRPLRRAAQRPPRSWPPSQPCWLPSRPCWLPLRRASPCRRRRGSWSRQCSHSQVVRSQAHSPQPVSFFRSAYDTSFPSLVVHVQADVHTTHSSLHKILHAARPLAH